MGWIRGREALVKMLLALGLAMGVAGLGPTAYAQVATTTVTDHVYHADGTAAAGTVLVSWPSFSTVAGASIPAGSESSAIGTGGVLSVALVPNAGANPIGSYYTVVYHLDDGSVVKEYWVVPVSASPVALTAVKSTVLPTSVAMQTVTKSYVDTAIAAALTGQPAVGTTTDYVLKTGDTMTGPLVLPGDPVSANQAADKHYVDASVAGVTGGTGGGGVSLNPVATQVVAQPAGTDLEVNRLNGVEHASQYETGAGNNGIAGATGASDCTGASAAGAGCVVAVDPTVGAAEAYSPSSWANRTHVVDERLGGRRDSFFNPRNPLDLGNEAGQTIDVVSTESTQAIHQSTTRQNVQSAGLVITHEGVAGGVNLFPENLEALPYGKTNYVAASLNGNYNTQGQHVLLSMQTNCYAVGDCLIGSQFITSSGGYRDSADEGAHPFDLSVKEDSRVFQGSCASGCTTGSRAVTVGSASSPGTQGDGRFLIDKNPAKVISQGQLTGGATGIHPVASFTATSFPVSTLFSTSGLIPSQANDLAPGTVSVAIATFGVGAGYSTNTAAAPSGTGVACVADRTSISNYEMANYTVVDGTHLQMTLAKPHGALATIAIGGLCGYGVEQTVDTVNGIRQVFPVIGSTSANTLFYAGANTAVLGMPGTTSAFQNLNATIVAASRTNNVVTLTLAGSLAGDVTGLTLSVTGVQDSSYNGSYVMTSTSPSTLSYADNGPNSTSAGGTASYLTGNYALYPMAEVTSVYNAATKGVDGLMTLAPNTAAWGQNDAVEEPHYFQTLVGGDIEFIDQTMPRPTQLSRAGFEYRSNVGPGVQGFEINNATAASNYLGNGGLHSYPDAAYVSAGIWNRTFVAQAGEQALFGVHCNSKGCNRWNSPYNLFELDSAVGVDTMNYSPVTSGLTFSSRGTAYSFTPQAFTANTANITTLNATTINGGTFNLGSVSSTSLATGALTATTVNATTLVGALDAGNIASGTVAAARLPVVGPSGASHAVGAVPDPGAVPGNTRFLREDGTWQAPPSGSGGVAGVATFNGRSGAIVPAAGDYNFGQISGSVATTQMPGLTGDVTTTAGTTAATLATVNGTTGVFGSSGGVPVLTIDGKGRVTNASTAAIAGPGGALAVPAALNTGLLADYNFYQQSGTVLSDVSGNGNNGTLQAGALAPTWVPAGLAFSPGQGVSLPAALNGAETVVIEGYFTPYIPPYTGNTYPSVVTSSLGGSGLNLLTVYADNSSVFSNQSTYAPSIYGAGGHRSSAPNLFSGFHVIGYVLGTGSGNVDHFYIDGVEVASYQVQVASAGLQTSGNLFIGSSNVSPWAGSGINGTAYRMRVYSTQLAPAAMASLTQAMVGEVALRGVQTAPVALNLATPQFHAIGDSITVGLGAPTGWPSLMTLTNQPSYTLTNWGISGIPLQSINASEANRVGLRCHSSVGTSVATVMAGTNDFSLLPGMTAQNVFNNLMGEVQTLKTAGCKVFVGTMISRTGNDQQGLTLDADKDLYNGLILSSAKAGGADGVIDFAAIPSLGADGANAGANFQSDHIHPNAAGQQLLANAASNALNYYFGAKESSPKAVTALPYAMAAGDGYVSVSGLTGAGGLTLPDCTGQSGATYRVTNLQSAFAVTVSGLNASQPINGLTTAVTVPANGSVAVRDVPNNETVSGCHWEM